MNERGKRLQPKLSLDMPFDEALARFAAVKPSELKEAVEKAKGSKGKDNGSSAVKPKNRKPQTPG